MVRVFLKGGVWKNSEDEVLKAAVQKYGKQQWARVASLLNRKTAKQAKARWYEWLDPSIRKTQEWSRVEEETLLHLAKLLPAQWKTIGPLVGGRTASQCQEHYEWLLDQAAATVSTSTTAGGAASGGGDEEEGNAASASASAVLRAGQVDAHPETRPAKPDPIDMDEDELEMLQEARARLANTLGKKAKRKQREKMLASAKRMADLQKRRELKAAGLLSTAARKTNKRTREIDLGIEIPFYKPAPAGFHDTGLEQIKTAQLQQQRLKQVDLHQVNESRYKSRDYEEAKAKKKEERRLQILEKMNDSYVKEKKQQEEAALLARPARGTLKLPEPTVSEDELNQMAKLQGQISLHGLADIAGPEATAVLLGDSSGHSLPSIMMHHHRSSSFASSHASVAATSALSAKTSATAAKRRDLVHEAIQLRQRERSTAPLLIQGDTDHHQHHVDKDNNDRNDHDNDDDHTMMTATARASDADEGEGGGGGVGDSASIGASTWATQSLSLRDLARHERRAKKRARLALEAALAALPAPLYEYEWAAPPEPAPAPAAASKNHDDDHEENELLLLFRKNNVPFLGEEDQADVEVAQREARRNVAEKKYQARSTVLKRPELPRPTHPHPKNDYHHLPTTDPENPDHYILAAAQAHQLIQEEMMRMIQHDNFNYPIASSSSSKIMSSSSSVPESGSDHVKKKQKRNTTDAMSLLPPETPLQHVSESSLEAARSAIHAELEVIMSEKISPLLVSSDSNDDSSILSSPEEAIAKVCRDAIAVSQAGAATMVRVRTTTEEEEGWIHDPTQEQRVASLRLEFDALKHATESLRKKNDKAAAKLKVVHGGYVKFAHTCSEEMQQVWDNTQNARIEQSVFRTLQSQERLGAAFRVERLEEDVKRLQSMETELQRKYGDLIVERRRKAILEATNGVI